MASLDVSNANLTPILKRTFEQYWEELCSYINRQQLETIPANLIYKHKGFNTFLLSTNRAIIDSQVTNSLTELEQKRCALQDKGYQNICQSLESTIYILVNTGTESEPNIEQISSQILYISLQTETDDNSEYAHFINIFKKCVAHTHHTWYDTDDYTIPSEIFESFQALFPDFIRQLQQDSFSKYTKLLKKKAPTDREIKKIERQIQIKVQELLADRISHIILPSGRRLKIIYE